MYYSLVYIVRCTFKLWSGVVMVSYTYWSGFGWGWRYDVGVGGEVRVGLELSEAKRVIKIFFFFFYCIFERTKIPLGLCKILYIGVGECKNNFC